MTPFLSLRPEGEGADVRLLFHDQPTSGARVLSGTIVHIAAVLPCSCSSRDSSPTRSTTPCIPQRLSEKLVWLVQPGPGGGGGGGNRSPEPPPRAELKGQQEISVPDVHAARAGAAGAGEDYRRLQSSRRDSCAADGWCDSDRRLATSWAPDRTATREAPVRRRRTGERAGGAVESWRTVSAW